MSSPIVVRTHPRGQHAGPMDAGHSVARGPPTHRRAERTRPDVEPLLPHLKGAGDGLDRGRLQDDDESAWSCHPHPLLTVPMIFAETRTNGVDSSTVCSVVRLAPELIQLH